MKQILVIDDDDSVRKVLRKKLETSGFEVIEADNGLNGIKQYERQNPDVIITDIIMPEEEGFKTIMEIREQDENVPIFAITGMSFIGGVDSLTVAQQFGANKGYLKPLDLNELVRDIEASLAK